MIAVAATVRMHVNVCNRNMAANQNGVPNTIKSNIVHLISTINKQNSWYDLQYFAYTVVNLVEQKVVFEVWVTHYAVHETEITRSKTCYWTVEISPDVPGDAYWASLNHTDQWP